MRSKTIGIAIAAAALASFAPASATTGANAVDTSYGNPQPQEEEGFPWGLLGLLGLAGLIPRKRHTHVDVDNRTGTRP